MTSVQKPISCNDLIITLIIIAILMLSVFAWLYVRGIRFDEQSQQLALEMSSLKQKNSKTIHSLLSELKSLNSTYHAQGIQLKDSVDALKKAQTHLEQSKAIQEKEKQTQLSSIKLLEDKVATQQQNIAQLKKEKAENQSQLMVSQQTLKESRMLSEQQFNEFKQLKRHFIETQYEANKRLKEIKDWQEEVKYLKKQLAHTKIKISQPKQRYTVFEMSQEILIKALPILKQRVK